MCASGVSNQSTLVLTMARVARVRQRAGVSSSRTDLSEISNGSILISHKSPPPLPLFPWWWRWWTKGFTAMFDPFLAAKSVINPARNISRERDNNKRTKRTRNNKVWKSESRSVQQTKLHLIDLVPRNPQNTKNLTICRIILSVEKGTSWWNLQL